MWFELFRGIAWASVLLLVPGYLVARGVGTDRLVGIACAPFIGVAAYSAVSIAYGALGIPCGSPTLCLPLAVLGGYLWYARARSGRRPLPALSVSGELRRPWMGGWGAASFSMACAVLTGLLVTSIVFLPSLGAADSFIPNYDNAWHLTRIHAFAKAHNFSSLYLATYPSAFHVIGALVETSMRVSTPVAENAICFAFPALAYPVSMVLLLATLFPSQPRRVVLGSLLCLAIAFFPWRIMMFGPLYPNMGAFTVMPAVTALFVRMVGDMDTLDERLRLAALFVIGGIALVLLQPNSVFSAGVFLIPFCLYECRRRVYQRFEGNRHQRAYALCAELVLLAVFVAIWIALVYAPFLKGIVWYKRKALNDPVQSLKWALALCYTIRRQQYLLGVIAIVGVGTLLFSDRRRWIAVSYLLSATLYVFAHGVPAPLKNIVAGFWYSDYFRLAAGASIFAIPVIACGIDTLIAVAEVLLERARPKLAQNDPTTLAAHLVGIVMTVAILLFNYVPVPVVPQGLRSYGYDTIKREMHATYAKKWFLEEDEMAFVEKVRAIVPEDTLVINQPFDGSVFTYSIYDLDVLFPYYGGTQGADEKTIRNKLNQIATDPSVQEAVERLGAKYLLQLDQGKGDIDGMNEAGSFSTLGYVTSSWRGINHIRDDTPGFTLLLSEGDMRLYQIDAAA